MSLTLRALGQARSIRRIQGRQQVGQSLVLVALMLSFLAIFLITAVEVAGRYLQRAEIEDALRQATRSAVQTFAYDKFAQNTQALKAGAPCVGTVSTGCSGNPVAAQAALMFVANLGDVGGLQDGETAASVAQKVVWTIGPTGGTCQGQTYTTPVVCAELDAPLRGLTSRYGSWTPQIEAAEKIDRFDTQ